MSSLGCLHPLPYDLQTCFLCPVPFWWWTCGSGTRKGTWNPSVELLEGSVLLQGGAWQGGSPSAGAAGAPSFWLRLGTAGAFVNRLCHSTQDTQKPFISTQVRSLSHQGAEVGLTSKALGLLARYPLIESSLLQVTMTAFGWTLSLCQDCTIPMENGCVE